MVLSFVDDMHIKTGMSKRTIYELLSIGSIFSDLIPFIKKTKTTQKQCYFISQLPYTEQEKLCNELKNKKESEYFKTIKAFISVRQAHKTNIKQYELIAGIYEIDWSKHTIHLLETEQGAV